MNCAQHTDTAAVAYCRSCGKALCEVCKRDVQGTIFCESCLAAHVHGGAAGSFSAAQGYPNTARHPEDASPGLALFLGFIPGVGAFYNGQFIKGFVHVIVFATLIWLSDHGMGAFAGILIPAWLFYMVFDAYSTAKARRFGYPIPDPLGLNAILEGRDGTLRQRMEQAGERLGTQVEYAAHNIGQQWQKAGGANPGASAQGFTAENPGTGQSANPAGMPPPPPPGAGYSAPQNGVPGSTGYVGPQGTYYSGPEGTYYAGPEGPAVPQKEREHNPVGAVVLIGLGMLFLLSNLGWFNFRWISSFWPMILIAVGVWLFVKRQRNAR